MTYTANSRILGTGTVSAEAIEAWFADLGPALAKQYAPDKTYRAAPAGIGRAMIDLSRQWGANHDLVAAQILHESAGWQSRIVRDKSNPSGLGAVNDNAYDGAVTFATPYDGIRATVAHLLVYAVGDGPWAVYDPRYDAVKAAKWLGTAPTLVGLNGKWASPGTTYGQAIAAGANALVYFANNATWETPMVAQIAGYDWHPADSRHFTRGRTAQIRGGAQHYTAGTNSLAWLTTSPNSNVSATFLIRNQPTLERRGWQLVRIEDTPHTTAFANPYTVSIEYEHQAHQTIPDIAYEVMAQTWIDVHDYLLERPQLGQIELSRAGIRGHREWVGGNTICPDGIDVDRIVAVIQRRLAEREPAPVDADAFLREGNPVGPFGLRLGFRDWAMAQGRARYPDDIVAGALSITGWPTSNEYQDANGLTLQHCQRLTLVYDANAAAPWDIVVELRETA